MTKVLVHPIQLNYKAKMHDVICGLCGRCTPAPPRTRA